MAKDIGDVILRPAAAGDGQHVFDLTADSIRALAGAHYSADQIAGWMGERTPGFYEAPIAEGRMVVAEQDGVILGFADALPGEVTRLFVSPVAAGRGLGQRLLAAAIEKACLGHDGVIRIESTLNAEGFYRRHGFKPVGGGFFSHGLGGEPIAIVHMELSARPG